MKKLTLSVATVALFILASCNSSSSDQAKTGEAQAAAATTGKELAVDAAATIVNWKGTHKGGMAPRFGTLNITSGTLSVDSGKITGGSFDVDMNTLKADSTSIAASEEKKASDLEGHLKSPDFFDVAKYATAKFVITGVVPFDTAKDKSLIEGATNMVSGNLTLKDSTINVTFPAKITITDASADVEAKFTVDRTQWNINYKTEGAPENWVISKEIELDIKLKAASK